MATETYCFKVAPEYTSATYYANGTVCVTMDEWAGRTLADFAAGMARKGGFAHRVETFNLSGRVIEEHYWTRNR